MRSGNKNMKASAVYPKQYGRKVMKLHTAHTAPGLKNNYVAGNAEAEYPGQLRKALYPKKAITAAEMMQLRAEAGSREVYSW